MREFNVEEYALIEEFHLRSNAVKGMESFRQWMSSSDLLDFKFAPALHHRVIMEALEDWARTPNAKLMIFLPFGSGKSVYASVQLPTWLWANDPTSAILAASNTQDFAESLARRRRDAVSTKEFSRLSGTELRADSKSVREFTNTKGGIMRAVGVAASCTGFRSNFNILDDPHVDFAQLDARKYRDEIFSWFTGIFRSRLGPEGRELIVTTRFSDDDLCGRLLEKEGEDWKVLRIPEVADDIDDPVGRALGERLWPAYLSEDRLLNRKRDPRLWMGCYQQRPPAESGTWLSTTDVPIVERAPKGLKAVSALDLALSVGKGDWSVVITAGLDEERNLYILDVWRKQVSIDDTAKALTIICQTYEPQEVLADDDNATKVFKTYCLDQFRNYGIYTPLRTLPTQGQDKETRAAPFRGIALQGRVFMVQADWNGELLAEILKFPTSEHDDQIDCLSLLGRHLFKMTGAAEKIEKPSAPIQGAFKRGADGKIYTTSSLDEMWSDRTLRISPRI